MLYTNKSIFCILVLYLHTSFFIHIDTDFNVDPKVTFNINNMYHSKYINSMSKSIHKVVIIGGGCAGLTAAIYCARAELKPLLFAGSFEDKGGLLTKTSIVENYPGFPDGIMGFDLIVNMETQAIKYGTEVLNLYVEEIDFKNHPFTLLDSEGNIHLAHSIIICTGSKPNKLYLPDEEKFWANGISSCAVCDGALYKNKKIVVVGGGDSAMEEALFLTKFSDVTLIHRRNEFRASRIMQERVLNNSKINVIFDAVIDKFNGNVYLESIDCSNVNIGRKFNIPVDGLFYGLGLKPNTRLFQDGPQKDHEDYIIKHPHTKFETATSISGVFVAGDATDKVYRQAVVACGDGCKAALDVIKYLEELDMNH